MIPDELKEKLKYGSALHSKLQTAVRDRINFSNRRYREAFAQMAKNEELFEAYIPERDADRLRRKERDAGLPQYTTIEIPYAYSIALTAHTYYSTVFLSRSPIFQFAGRHGSTEMDVQAIEALMDYQIQVGKNIPPLFIWTFDPLKYGYGVVSHYWDEQYTTTRTFAMQPQTFLGMPLPGTERRVAEVRKLRTFSGNRLYNVRPQDFLPDPRVPLWRFQDGEFCGRFVEIPWTEMHRKFKDGYYFNEKAVRHSLRDKEDTHQGTTTDRDMGSPNVRPLANDGGLDGYEIPIGFVKGYQVFLKLVPSEWGLGKTSDYEIWVITLTTNGIVFCVEPLGEYHGGFPFDVLPGEVDGYSLFPRAQMEIVRPLNQVLTWLINSHFYNVRAALNNQFVVDPSAVFMKDLENPRPGKLIRLRPEALGRDIRTIIAQLPVQDITRSNLSDFSLMAEMIQRMTGVVDPVMGMASGVDRETATGVRTRTNFSTTRLKTVCEWLSATGFGPLAQKMVQRSQQFYEDDLKLRVVGDLAQMTEGFVRVAPESIAGFYDYVPVDGTLPVDRYAQANLWQQFMGQMTNFPQIMATYDIAKVFAWVAQLGGLKNVNRFRLAGPGRLQQQVQAGNVIPLRDVQQDLGRPPDQLQLPTMGATS